MNITIIDCKKEKLLLLYHHIDNDRLGFDILVNVINNPFMSNSFIKEPTTIKIIEESNHELIRKEKESVVLYNNKEYSYADFDINVSSNYRTKYVINHNKKQYLLITDDIVKLFDFKDYLNDIIHSWFEDELELQSDLNVPDGYKEIILT